MPYFVNIPYLAPLYLIHGLNNMGTIKSTEFRCTRRMEIPDLRAICLVIRARAGGNDAVVAVSIVTANGTGELKFARIGRRSRVKN